VLRVSAVTRGERDRPGRHLGTALLINSSFAVFEPLWVVGGCGWGVLIT